MIYVDEEKVVEESNENILSDIVLEEEFDIDINEDADVTNNQAQNDKVPEASNTNSKPDNDEEGVDIKAEEVSVTKDYVTGHFLEGILDPMAKDVTNKIIDMKINKDCDIADMVQVIESVNSANYSDSTKDHIYKMLCEAYLESNREYSTTDYVLEYAGKPEKNKEFIKILELTEKYITDCINCTNMLYKLGDKYIEILGKVHGENPDAKKLVNDCRLAYEDFFKWYDKNMRDEVTNGINNFKKFNRLRKTFNNKYSTEIMEVKKEADKKLDALYTEVLNGEIRQWMQVEEGDKCEKWDRLVELWGALKQIDIDEAGKCAQYAINPFVQCLSQQVVYTVRLIQCVRYYLDIEKENSTKYKIVQKIFKDKKKDNKDDDLNDKFSLKTITMTV